MKKIYTTMIAGLCMYASHAQITITNNDMPSANDTARITLATINPFINYGATGPNHTWNFANLRNNGQDLKSFLSVNSTNVLYSLYFSNLPFNPNRANVATTGTAIPANPLLTISDPYNFYYRSTSVYKQVGFGAEVSSIPLPVAFSQHDVIYNLPLNYGTQDTSNSAWNIGLPGLGYYGFTQTRINNVDGWGTLTTPHATYNVLRVKTELFAKDTISVDTLGLNFALDRPKTTEYKWLANGDKVPVMQITTTEILGLEIVTEIFFRDDYNTIQPGLLNAAYCAGSTITLPYVTTGSYNAPGFLQPGNVFTAQLSDSTGSFVSPVNIGNVTATASGNVTVTIPANTPPGNLYRIRFVSSSPAVTGGDNGFDIKIENAAISTIASTGATTFCAGDSVYLQSTSVAPGYSYQWQLGGIDISGATSTDLYVNAAGNYTLNTTNSCGTVASNAINVAINPSPVAAILPPASLSFCAGNSVVLNAVTDSSYNYQWQLNGTDLAGETLSTLTVTQAGDYSLVVSNGLCGSDTSLALTLSVDALPVANISASGNTTFCVGDSVILSATTAAGYTYQWQLNGVDLAGETAANLTAYQAGNYGLVVTSGSCGSDTASIIAVTVNQGPVATISSTANTVVCSGDSVMLTANAGTGYTYQWQLNGVDISGETQISYGAVASGNYTAIVSNACGSVVSNVIAITVYPAVVVPIISLQNDSLVSSTAVTYQWYYNGVLIAGATNGFYVPTQNGDYTVVITDANGCTAISSVFTMTTVGLIETEPNVAIILFPNPANDKITLSGKGFMTNGKISIMSSSGQIMNEIILDADKNNPLTTVDISNLANGMYIVRLQSSELNHYLKFVKK